QRAWASQPPLFAAHGSTLGAPPSGGGGGGFVVDVSSAGGGASLLLHAAAPRARGREASQDQRFEPIRVIIEKLLLRRGEPWARAVMPVRRGTHGRIRATRGVGGARKRPLCARISAPSRGPVIRSDVGCTRHRASPRPSSPRPSPRR